MTIVNCWGDEGHYDFATLVDKLNLYLRLKATVVGMKRLRTVAEMKCIPNTHRPVVVLRRRDHVKEPRLAVKLADVAVCRVPPPPSLVGHKADAINALAIIEAVHRVLVVPLLKRGRKLDIKKWISARRSWQAHFQKTPLFVPLFVYRFG